MQSPASREDKDGGAGMYLAILGYGVGKQYTTPGIPLNLWMPHRSTILQGASLARLPPLKYVNKIKMAAHLHTLFYSKPYTDPHAPGEREDGTFPAHLALGINPTLGYGFVCFFWCPSSKGWLHRMLQEKKELLKLGNLGQW